MKTTKILFVAILTLFMIMPTQAYAGFQGSNCSNSGATISKSGSEYICKNVSGKLKWQKKSTTGGKSLAKYNSCMNDYFGVPLGDPSMDEARLMQARGICAKFKP